MGGKSIAIRALSTRAERRRLKALQKLSRRRRGAAGSVRFGLEEQSHSPPCFLADERCQANTDNSVDSVASL